MRRILIGAALAAALLVPGIRAVSADQERPSPTVSYTVRAGDTLWRIAGAVDPNADPRRVVHRLMELNEIGPGGLIPGQTIQLPAR